MKIVNPFYPHPHVRFRFNGGEMCLVTGDQVVEAPEDAKDCLIEAIDKGRSDGAVLCEGRMWSPEIGVMSVKAYADSLEIMKQKKLLREEREKDANRKAKEARERGNQKKVVSEKPKRVVEEKKLDLGDELKL